MISKVGSIVIGILLWESVSWAGCSSSRMVKIHSLEDDNSFYMPAVPLMRSERKTDLFEEEIEYPRPLLFYGGEEKLQDNQLVFPDDFIEFSDNFKEEVNHFARIGSYTGSPHSLFEIRNYYLDLPRLSIRNITVSDEWDQFLGFVLRESHIIKRLDISKCGIQSDLFQVLSGIRLSNSLETFKLSGTNVTADILESLGYYLSLNTTLKTLKLSKNTIDLEAIQLLTHYFKIQTSITTLVLNESNLSDAHVPFMRDLLQVNSKITIRALKNFFDYEGKKLNDKFPDRFII